jgi:formate dehydrogenase subunit beta
MVEGVEGDRAEAEIETAELTELKAKRQTQKETLDTELQLDGFGLDGLVTLFGRCVNCRNCREVCPICYCKLCDFDSAGYERDLNSYGAELEKRPGVRVPPDTVLFHLGRLSHMAVSCVACGMCSDVCPVDIPVSALFARAGESIQGVFDYVPGRNENEELPMVRFEMEELEELTA